KQLAFRQKASTNPRKPLAPRTACVGGSVYRGTGSARRVGCHATFCVNDAVDVEAGVDVERRALDVTVSLVDHKSGSMTGDCLRSLFDSTRSSLEVFVIENVPSAPTHAMLFPQVRVVRNAKPRGFSENHNAAIARGTGRYHLILNDDTIISKGAIDRLVAFA